ncbi:hypothetical protein POM88_048015 [Heracleum sosnowskyi]|uniref:Leucine-rich repeat-containing N-terminal plant-type domain-containing protein n=1 Tax=Heracleum sosnowskyi TaxID=360622 RepID=A0AAD8GUI7_9APIA|nr:hypothetical protein POM88_048015 [Heracleum sosnowskyi]
MRKCLWLCSIIVTWFLQHPQVATADLCPNMQKLALFQFKLSLSINTSASIEYCRRWSSSLHPKMMNWSMSSDGCIWDGVTCNQMTGDVIGLDLSCSQLVGVIPRNSILFQLSHLKYLNIHIAGRGRPMRLIIVE